MASPGGFIAYYRISNTKQTLSELRIPSQRRAIYNYLKKRDPKIIRRFTEVEDGRPTDRPELVKAIKIARRRRVPIIVAKLGHLKRSGAFLSQLLEAGVDVCFADLPATDKPKRRVMLRRMVAVAESHAKLRSKRIKIALSAARARGKQLGGNRGAELLAKAGAAGNAVVIARANAQAACIAPIITKIRASGVSSLHGIAKVLTDRAVPTARNQGPWSAVQVKRVLKRL